MTDKTTTGSDAVDLLPCPFCGGTNIDPAEWSGNDGKSGPGCEDCGALAETARDWNRRALIAQARAAAPAATAEPALLSDSAEWLDVLGAYAEKPGMDTLIAVTNFADNFVRRAAALSQQPVQAAGEPLRGAFLDNEGYVRLCTAGKEHEYSNFASYIYAAPTIAAPTAPSDLSKLTKWGAGMIAVGWQNNKELYVKVSDLERALQQIADVPADGEPWVIASEAIASYHAAPAPQQAPLTDNDKDAK